MGSYLSAAVFAVFFTAGLFTGLLAGIRFAQAFQRAGIRKRKRKEKRRSRRRSRRARRKEGAGGAGEDTGCVPLKDRMIRKSSWVDFNCSEDGIDENLYISGSRKNQNSSYRIIQKRGTRNGTEEN